MGDNIFAAANSNNYFIMNQPEDDGKQSQGRRYDLSITYDFYYQTPRLWLLGYNEGGQLLTQEEIFEDIMAEYAHKTVTYEAHPHMAYKNASIHPCNHAKVMKKIIDTIKENGGEIGPHQSMFVFFEVHIKHSAHY